MNSKRKHFLCSVSAPSARDSFIAPDPNVSVMRASTAEFEGLLQLLPHVVYRDLVLDLDLKGEAHRYDALNQSVYYLQRANDSVIMWTWCPIGSYWEAAILRILIASEKESLSSETATQILFRATNRRPDFLVPSRSRTPSPHDVASEMIVVQLSLLAADRLWKLVRALRKRALYTAT
jgi:hypothetical protein